MVNNGITEKELSRAKAQAVNALYMNAESNMTLMRLYGRCMLKSGKLYNVDEEIDAYTSLTVADVNAIAREIFAQKHASAYVGKQIDDCDEYYGFLGQLKKLHDKVDSGDLSDFTELKL